MEQSTKPQAPAASRKQVVIAGLAITAIGCRLVDLYTLGVADAVSGLLRWYDLPLVLALAFGGGPPPDPTEAECEERLGGRPDEGRDRVFAYCRRPLIPLRRGPGPKEGGLAAYYATEGRLSQGRRGRRPGRRGPPPPTPP